jgi:hypothetical protein
MGEDMGRKRLLTILAGAVAVVGLHMGPAAALDTSLDDPIKKVLDGVDSEIAKQCEDEGTVALVEKCVAKLEASADDTSGDTKTTTETTTKKTTDTVKESTKSTTDGGGGDTSTPTKPSSTSGGSGGSGGSTSSGSSSSGGGVAAAGGAQSAEASHERPRALDPEEARRFLASSRESLDTSGPRGGVTPAFDLSDLDDPLVAGDAESSSESEWQAASPETAPPRSDAELAAIPAESPGDVPAGLKLVAALLVAGTGTLWHLTRRELQPIKA